MRRCPKKCQTQEAMRCIWGHLCSKFSGGESREGFGLATSTMPTRCHTIPCPILLQSKKKWPLFFPTWYKYRLMRQGWKIFLISQKQITQMITVNKKNNKSIFYTAMLSKIRPSPLSLLVRIELDSRMVVRHWQCPICKWLYDGTMKYIFCEISSGLPSF